MTLERNVRMGAVQFVSLASLLCCTVHSSADLCLLEFHALHNYKKCCANNGHEQPGRQPVCAAVAPRVRALPGMQPNCEGKESKSPPPRAEQPPMSVDDFEKLPGWRRATDADATPAPAPTPSNAEPETWRRPDENCTDEERTGLRLWEVDASCADLAPYCKDEQNYGQTIRSCV